MCVMDNQYRLTMRCSRRAKTRTPREVVFTYGGKPHAIGGDWFCPGCGVPTQELTPGALRCPACSRSLVEFVHSLIERHPHFDGVSRYT